jgi:Bacterial sugar transferase
VATGTCKWSAGLTGLWQVNGKNKTTFNEMIVIDLFYLENMSILLDLKIMLKTGAVIARQLLEFQQETKCNRTKLQEVVIPTSVVATGTQTGFETDRPTKNTLEEMI